MENLRNNILKVLRTDQAFTVPEIAFALLAYQDVVQRALHELDDQGLVSMRNGLYRRSQKAIQEDKT